MNKKIVALTLGLSCVFMTSCGTQPRQNQQQQNQPIGGIESSVNKMGKIERIKVATEGANIRAGCNTNSPVLQTPGKDSSFDVTGQVADWFAVKLPNNNIGFIPKDQAKPVVVEDKKADVTPENSVAPSQGTTSPKTPTEQTNATSLTNEEQEMIKLINEARAQNNVPALTVDMQLTNVARVKAQDMIDNNYFSHNSPKYGSPFDMMQSFGIKYVQAGENIAGNQNVQNAHNALMNSPGHRKNILNPDFTHIGLGIKQGGPYGNMFTQMFISKPK